MNRPASLSKALRVAFATMVIGGAFAVPAKACDITTYEQPDGSVVVVIRTKDGHYYVAKDGTKACMNYYLDHCVND